MNTVIQALFARTSTRVFDDRPVDEAVVNLIIDAAIQAPSAGNQQLWTIIDVRDISVKERLAVLCDNQPFIAKAPLVFVILADCRRWFDCYHEAGAPAVREPGPGDALLACVDAVAAAQNMVIAAESLGLGSCYIGDILENKEETAALLCLDKWTIPAAMLVAGYPAAAQTAHQKPPRPARKYLVRRDRYTPLSPDELRSLHESLHAPEENFNFDHAVSAFCKRKYMSDFAREMNRSAAEYLKNFTSQRADTKGRSAAAP